MSTQIFKKIYPKDDLIKFIEKFAYNNSKYYIINKSYYKRAIFLDIIDEFIDIITPYYHISKRKYIENVNNYTKFITIIRHLCKSNDINYVSKILYNKGTYDINYYIYI